MKPDHARASLYQRVTDQIIAELERGVMPWRKPWNAEHLNGRVSLPLRHNGEAYRGINVLTLWMAGTALGYSSPTWMTYRQALELGGQVRGGEKGSPVVYAGKLVKAGEDSAEHEDPREIRYLKSYCVFNVCQIDGLPDTFYAKPDVPVLAVPERNARAEAFFDAVGAVTRHGGTRAYYSPPMDYISMPPFESFENAESYYAIRAHECVHWTGHVTRLDRLAWPVRSGSPEYMKEELVAELGAAFLCVFLQLTPELRPAHASYIEHWLKMLRGDNRAIFAAAAHAQRAADYLLARQPPSPG